MKVLMYHWTQDDFPKLRGGGIQSYQRDIIPELLKVDKIHLTVLSSGTAELYDFFRPTIRIEALDSSTSGLQRFGLINSPIPAPSIQSWGNVFSLEHQETREVFFDFIEEHGFEVIHFNHLEGLPAEVLTLKKRFPHIKILFSMHDYYSLCPQVAFLYQEKELCDDGQSGKKCQSCLPVYPHIFSVTRKRADRVTSKLVHNMGLNPAGRIAKTAQQFFQKMVFGKPKTERYSSSSGDVFRNWHQFVDLINNHVDYVLSVSDRVNQIAIRHGIRTSLLRVLRLGKNEALQFRNTPPPQGLLVNEEGCLTLAYLGYMTIHKGFFFLLESLEQMSDKTSLKINLVIAAKSPKDHSILERLMRLRPKLKSLTYYNGYTQDQLDEILTPGTVGILCHLWEETGPLTAWEMHCRRIPFLTSNLGGGPEISGCNKMVYEHRNIQEFLARVRMILDGGITHEEYWKNSLTPITVEEHCKELINYYQF